MDTVFNFVLDHPFFCAGVVLAGIVTIGTFVLALLPYPPVTPDEIRQLQNAGEAAKQRVWDKTSEQHKLFSDRLNYFLIFESVSFAVIGSVFSPLSASDKPTKFVALFGLLVSLLWLYIQARQKSILETARARNEIANPDDVLTLQRLKRWPVSGTGLLAYFVPLVVTLMWIGLLAFVDGNLFGF